MRAPSIILGIALLAAAASFIGALGGCDRTGAIVSPTKVDTLIVYRPGRVDTVIVAKLDTVVVTKVDTLIRQRVDTVIRQLPGRVDTLYVPRLDTLYLTRVDTVVQRKTDTLLVVTHDTTVVVQHDTVTKIHVDTVYLSRTPAWLCLTITARDTVFAITPHNGPYCDAVHLKDQFPGQVIVDADSVVMTLPALRSAARTPSPLILPSYWRTHHP
jgi:hypothetical protein